MEEYLDEMELSFLSKNEARTILYIGETILGVPTEELGKEFVQAVDIYIIKLDDYLHRDIHTLFWLFDSRLFSTLFVRSFRKFHSMSIKKRQKYVEKWMKNRIPLFRTGYRTLQALCGWSYYSLDKSFPEMNYPGHTIGREHETPTLLFGKQPWEPVSK